MGYKLASAAAVLSLGLGFGQASASLIFLGPGSLGGQGLGAVETVLTITSQGASTTESGCVSAGTGGGTLVGPGSCPGSGPHGLDPFTGGDEQAINEAHAASALGLTNFNALRILFNPSEPPPASGITVGNLSLTLWNPADGLILDAYYIEDPVVLASSDPGTGNAGFFFGLDATQAATANSLLVAFPNGAPVSA